jgi:hypothetical protein
MRRRPLVVLLVVFSLFQQLKAQHEHANDSAAASPTGVGMHHHKLTSSGGVTTLPGGINGALTPQLIPDSTAYRMFFLAIAEPANAKPDRLARQQAMLSRLRLSPSDLAAIFSTLANFHSQAQALGLTAGATSVAAGTNPAVYNAQCDSVVDAAHEALRSSLSVAGFARLEAYVQSEKRHMIIFPSPSMESN